LEKGKILEEEKSKKKTFFSLNFSWFGNFKKEKLLREEKTEKQRLKYFLVHEINKCPLTH
jgi:hypothetical protein